MSISEITSTKKRESPKSTLRIRTEKFISFILLLIGSELFGKDKVFKDWSTIQ